VAHGLRAEIYGAVRNFSNGLWQAKGIWYSIAEPFKAHQYNNDDPAPASKQ
jgi:hypothetical protein